MRVADRLEVLVLVDNVTDSLSTTPKNVIAEWPGLVAAGRLLWPPNPHTFAAPRRSRDASLVCPSSSEVVGRGPRPGVR